MQTLIVVALPALCLMGTSSLALADDAMKGDMGNMKDEMKAEKDTMKARCHEMKGKMKAHKDATKANPAAPAAAP
jgi:Sec-independent protein translocase protein TatA